VQWQIGTLLACLGALALGEPASAQVSGYLPLNLEPALEQQVEKFMAIAGRPVMTRPIPVADVQDALPAGCEIDPASCALVRAWLVRWSVATGITAAGIEVAATRDDWPAGRDLPIPDSHGQPLHSAGSAFASAYARYGDHLAFNAGIIARRDSTSPSGTFVSLGGRRAQLDVGYRDHWWSPLSDHSWLMSTEAATIPTLTLSNTLPLTRLHLRYEVFYGQLSRSDKIDFNGGMVSGHPRVFGFHLSTEPAPGWSLGVGRLMQFGPAPRPASLGNLFSAFFNPSRYDNTRPGFGAIQEFGNEQFSLTSSFTVPGPQPVVAYAEFAAEDTFHAESYRFGNSALSGGLYLPALARRLGLRYEFSAWQDSWYVHHIYGDGLHNDGAVLGSWMGDWRNPNDAVGGRSHMLALAWQWDGDRRLDARLRTLQNANYSGAGYRRGYDLTVAYWRPWRGLGLGLGLEAGRDVLASRYARLSASLQLSPSGSVHAAVAGDDPGPDNHTAGVGMRVERFVDIGLKTGSMRYEYDAGGVPAVATTFGSAHIGIGIRRLYDSHSDFGARLELDNVHGRALMGLRAIDYRYRHGEHLALSAFMGVARYDAPTVALGWYAGAGLQWRNLFAKWDLALDFNFADKLQRDKLAPGESAVRWPDAFYSVAARTFTLSRRF
jgi:hypothetical protein